MANKSGRVSAMPEMERASSVTTEIPRVQVASTPDTSGVAGQAILSLADTLQGISMKVEDRMDLLAQVEGAEAGQIAGDNGVPIRADDMTIRGRAFNQAAAESYSIDMDLQTRQTLAEYEEQSGEDTTAFLKKADSYIAGVESEMAGFDRGMAQKFSADLQIRRDSAVNRIKSKAEASLRERQLEGAMRLQIALNDQIAEQAQSLFSVPADQTENVLQGLMSNGGRLIDMANQVGPDGKPLFSAAQRIEIERKAEMAIAHEVGVAWLRQQPDINEGVLALSQGTAKFEIVGKDGAKQVINLRDMVGASMMDELAAGVSRKVMAERSLEDAARSAGEESAYSNFNLAIEKANTLPELESLSRQVDISQDKMGGLVKANNLRVKILQKQSKFQEETDSVIRGSQFASGTVVPNPQNEKDVKDFNTYFEKAVMPELAKLEPDQKNARLANIISDARIVPKQVKGQIEIASKSIDADVVSNAADLIDRVRNTNPNMLRDFSEKDLARIEMVRAYKESGYLGTEAVEQADLALSPNNEAVFRQRKDDLTKMKKDYRGAAIGVFQTNALVRLAPGQQGITDEASGPTGTQLTQMETDYRRAFEGHYQMTGREDLARKHADSVLRGLYSVSEINPRKQVMKYAPENFYSVPGIGNEWMRKQMLKEAKAAAARSLMSPDFDADKDVLLVSDPYRTPRTAKSGRPEYKLMYIDRQDGTLRDLLGPGQFFYFDPGEETQKLIDDARRKSEAPPLDQIPTGGAFH